jgi:hypothetical protein
MVLRDKFAIRGFVWSTKISTLTIWDYAKILGFNKHTKRKHLDKTRPRVRISPDHSIELNTLSAIQREPYTSNWQGKV